MNHATIRLGGYDIPLIGLPKTATLEECDLCGDLHGIQQIEITGTQFLCNKCNHEPNKLHAQSSAKHYS